MANRHQEFPKEWDALPEKEKDRRRKAIAGWADRINAEDKALALQFELKNNNKKPGELPGFFALQEACNAQGVSSRIFAFRRFSQILHHTP